MSYLHNFPASSALQIHQDARGLLTFSQGGEESTLRQRPDKFNVFVRLKPLNILNITDDINTDCYGVNGQELTTKSKNPKNEIITSKYSFTKVFLPSSSQDAIYDSAVKSNLDLFLGGDNSLIFAYGASGSGKTYTMQGTYSKPGIIPRILYTIFNSVGDHKDETAKYCPDGCLVYIRNEKEIAEQVKNKKRLLNLVKKQVFKNKDQLESNDTISYTSFESINESLKGLKKINVEATKDTVFSVWISMCEIYNENLADLLVPPKEQVPLSLAEDNSSVFVKGLTQFNVQTWEEAYELYRYGKHNLHISETNINKKSSRSHCVFNIKLVKRDVTKPTKFENVSSFSVCDLAGSERITKTGSRKQISKEAKSINTSLFVLNKCIELIRKSQQLGTSLRIPFRESKLTRLLSKNLLGEGTVTIIVNITQEGDFSGETLQTLRATAHASKIEIKPFKEPKLNHQLALASASLENLHLDDLNQQIVEYKTTIHKLERTNQSQQKEIEELKRLLQSKENERYTEDNELKILKTRFRELERKNFLLAVEHEALDIEVHNAKMDLVSCFNVEGDPDLGEAVRYACKKITTYRHYRKIEMNERAEEIKEYEEEIALLQGKIMELMQDKQDQEILQTIKESMMAEKFDLSQSDQGSVFGKDTECRNESVLMENRSKCSNGSVVAEKESEDEKQSTTFPLKEEEVLVETVSAKLPDENGPESASWRLEVSADEDNIQENVQKSVKKSTRKKLLPRNQDDYLGDDFVPVDTPRKERALSTNTFIKSLHKKK